MKQNPDFNRLHRLVMTKCAQHNVSMEKRAMIGALLKKLFGGAMAKGKSLLGAAGKKAIVPGAIGGAGVGGYALGNSAGHSRGFTAGDNAGYGRGLGEGGSTATRNLFKGLMDLQSQGAKSKTDLSSLMPKSGSAQMTWTEKRAFNIKLARIVLNINAIDQELAKYDLHRLQKSAAVGAHRVYRIKYAALIRQRELEKQAFLGLLGRGLMAGGRMLGKGLMGGARAGAAVGKGIGGMAYQGARAAAPHVGQAARQGISGAAQGLQSLGRGAMAAGRAAAPHASKAMQSMGRGVQAVGRGAQAAGQGAAGAIRANPMAGAAGTGALGLMGGMAMPSITSGAQQAAGTAQSSLQNAGQGISNGFNSTMQGIGNMYNSATQPFRDAGDAVGTAYGNASNFIGNTGRALGDVQSGFQQAGNRF
jgi:hypothetical protein